MRSVNAAIIAERIAEIPKKSATELSELRDSLLEELRSNNPMSSENKQSMLEYQILLAKEINGRNEQAAPTTTPAQDATAKHKDTSDTALESRFTELRQINVYTMTPQESAELGQLQLERSRRDRVAVDKTLAADKAERDAIHEKSVADGLRAAQRVKDANFSGEGSFEGNCLQAHIDNQKAETKKLNLGE